MNREERNQRKKTWMAHGFGIAKRFMETGYSITSTLDNVSENGANEFDAHTQILEEIETLLHDCGMAAFSEKFIIFMLANAELNRAETLQR